MAAAGKVVLDENHRRVVSVALRGVEKMCDAIVQVLDRTPGLLEGIQDDLGPRDAPEIRKLAERTREELRRISMEVELDRAHQSRRRSIVALLSATRIDVEEVKSPTLRGYGPIAPETEEAIDALMERLLVLVNAMSRVAENG